MADEAREVEALFRSPTDTIGATFRAYAFGSNPEFSNQPLAKAKSWELRFYRKTPCEASKKLANFTKASKRGSVSPIKIRRRERRRQRSLPKTLTQAGKVAFFCQRDGENAFNRCTNMIPNNAFPQLELPALFRFR